MIPSGKPRIQNPEFRMSSCAADSNPPVSSIPGTTVYRCALAGAQNTWYAEFPAADRLHDRPDPRNSQYCLEIPTPDGKKTPSSFLFCLTLVLATTKYGWIH
eukprot:COSAG02_NODE_5893_length_3956_cov_15.470832_3_plen_102_part_00